MDEPLTQQLLDKVKAYKMPPAAIELLTKHQPLIIAGASGVGKETIIRAIQDSSRGAKVVTHTTRHPREGEHNGVDYWFVTQPRMIELIEEESFIEVKAIHNQQVSGSSLAAYQTIVDEGQHPLLALDVQGIEEVRHHVLGLKPVFILPPNFEAWMERLEGRGEMSHTERLRRLDSAKDELQRALDDEHFMLVVNHDVNQAAQEILQNVSDPATQAQNRDVAQKLIHSINAY